MDYLKALTDDTGVFQHAKFCIPKRGEGYTTDDNARALIACTRYLQIKKDPSMVALSNVYLSFLYHMQKSDGTFHNYLGYERRYLDIDGSEDCAGRALWGCGCAVNSPLPSYQRMVARDIFDQALPKISKSIHLRAYASAILGLAQYYQASPRKDIKDELEKFADQLVEQYIQQPKEDDSWQWFENILTYDNARLPQALFEAYLIVPNQEYLDVARESMNFLISTQIINNVFIPIGNDGWYRKSGNRAFFDQQPIEAAGIVDASMAAFYATKDTRYLEIADIAFEWFLGRNNRNKRMFCSDTSGCFDGLNVDSVNLNQGAESSISYLLARLKLEEHRRGMRKQKRS